MFDIFTTTHSEQRAVLYEGSEEISVKTATLMLSRLYTNYYNEIERERVIYVLTKLGYLTSDNVKNNTENSDSLLDRANETIRKANARINELKLQLKAAELTISGLYEANQELNNRLQELSCSLSDKDILGFDQLPSGYELKKRYKSLAAIHHPDKGGSKHMMQRINESYENLKSQVA
ncbi:J domain-containing protein [Vibrio cholerae]|uniref:J domain-containing protein n=1 Tax=Vibrio cholerae TaxID=666 RepID=UPI001159DDDC|nr:J domain-containing protein [Vibrio cholerae]TQP09412.1 J domain-containing protein [Vibrio cholerae]